MSVEMIVTVDTSTGGTLLAAADCSFVFAGYDALDALQNRMVSAQASCAAFLALRP